MRSKILVVDDEMPILELLGEMLRDHGFDVEAVNNGTQAIKAFQENHHELVISDLIMPGISGLEVISTIKRLDKEVEVIVLTGYATIDNAVQALRNYNAFDFLTKPLDNLDALLNTIEKALERRQLQKENKSLIEALKQANDELERRVKARTMELAQVNERLRNELAERKEIEKKIRKARETAEFVSRIKNDFLFNISHELREPLNSVIGFSRALLDKFFGPLTEQQEECLKNVYENGRHLFFLVDDILDLTTLDDDKDNLKLTPVNICEEIEKSLKLTRKKTIKHAIEIELSIDNNLCGIQMMMDVRRIRQILFYLLSDAINFANDAGRVEVSARKRSALETELKKNKEKSEAFLELSITDIGIEIAPEDQKNIFDGFFQVKSDKIDKIPVTGLGLSLARKLAEVHGGWISVASGEAEKGCRFTVFLPILLKK